jgi:hypothetical protein
MKKHTVGMVFLLIVALSLIGAVSASDNMTLGDDVQMLDSQYGGEVELGCEFESSDEISLDCDDSQTTRQIDDSHQDSSSVPESEEAGSLEYDFGYEFGYEITEDFAGIVEIENWDDVLIVMNAGFLNINNQTTENVLDGILDASNGCINYEDGNLITVSSTADSVNVAFVYKNQESLTIALYKDSKNHIYYNEIGPDIAASHLEKLELDEEDLASYLTIIRSWTNGHLADLNLLTFKRNVPFGLLGVNEKLQTVKYYPHEFDLLLADALGVSRDFDDDAFTLEKSNSSDERASVDVDMVGRSMEESSSLDLYDIGIDASKKALDYFKSKGVDIPKDYPYLYVLTSAGHVKVNGLKTDEVLDGLLEGLGSKFDSEHLISVDDPSWKDLVFYFIVVKNTKIISYALKYDSATGKLIESDKVKEQGDNMAQEMGLYSIYSEDDDGSDYYEGPIREACQEIISKSTSKGLNQTAHANVTGSKNSQANASNASVKTKKSGPVEAPKEHNGPVNILYNLASVLIVCGIFGVGYRKR